MDGAEDGAAVEITALARIAEIDAAEWDACAAPECADGGRPLHPFLAHRFLSAFEASGSVSPRTGWAPRHLVARHGGKVIGVAPMYLKGHSQGEYVFDHSWAHAFERAGGDYYPKLQGAVPFTPVTGPRFLLHPDADPVQAMGALVEGAVQLAAQGGLSSVHWTFCTEAEAAAGAAMGLLRRTHQQFHWIDEGFGDYEGFLASLSSRKRKALRKERRTAQESGLRIVQLTGDAIEPEHWDAFWRFYQDTGARKWGSPYLTRAFFDIAQDTLRDDLLLVLAGREGPGGMEWVAGALNVIGRDTLFGRYWGCTEHHPCLHFELCYHQAIDWALAHGQTRVEAGAQGEHKLARGYLPVETHSLHWIANPSFRDAVADFLEHERAAVDEEMAWLSDRSPFRQAPPPPEEHD
ncbi:GNAT family N-acetyltransferase [Rhodovulum sp. DZ06]|uniref:GNAT family N-acetyltransferase n=1 Tax=Rhodovulum sp. DZ06 TaxID=3425126 RepID=UPI003D3542B8